MRCSCWFYALALLAGPAAAAQDQFTVTSSMIGDQKAVFATVESAHIATARSQLGGTIVAYNIQPGDAVSQGQTIATVVDPTLAAQLTALDADISGLTAQLAQAKTDATRDEQLIESGAIANSTLDDAQTAVNVAASELKSRIAARAALSQQVIDGAVLAPVSGRVLQTPVTQGMVVLPGDSIATIAEQDYVLRLELPERHAQFIHRGDPIRLDPDDTAAPVFGKITLIYPQIQDGDVEADATAPGLGNYYTGSRIEVWVFAGRRLGIVIPQRFIETRFGLDYAELRQADGSTIAVPVQTGEPQPTPALPSGIEILSGLHPGDVLAAP